MGKADKTLTKTEWEILRGELLRAFNSSTYDYGMGLNYPYRVYMMLALLDLPPAAHRKLVHDEFKVAEAETEAEADARVEAWRLIHLARYLCQLHREKKIYLSKKAQQRMRAINFGGNLAWVEDLAKVKGVAISRPKGRPDYEFFDRPFLPAMARLQQQRIPDPIPDWRPEELPDDPLAEPSEQQKKIVILENLSARAAARALAPYLVGGGSEDSRAKRLERFWLKTETAKAAARLAYVT